MVTQEEQDARDERTANIASPKLRIDEEEIDGVTWIKHVRPDREEEQE